MRKMYKMFSFHILTRNVETLLYTFLAVANLEFLLDIGKAATYDNTSPIWQEIIQKKYGRIVFFFAGCSMGGAVAHQGSREMP